MIFKLINKKDSQKGIALLLAVFCTMILTFLALEVSFDSSVEYVLSGKEINRVKALEAAKAGYELSLMRIQLFKNVTAQYGDQLKGQEGILQMVWSFPFMWPPAVPTETSIADKDLVQSSVGESLMDATYATSISSEGSKIDLNDLDSLSEPLAKAVRLQLLNLFEQKIENDDDFAEKYRNLRPEELVNNIQDYIDEDKESLNSGDERSAYGEMPDLKNSDVDFPPNRPFQTLDEVRSVAGMDEELFQFLLPQITVYGIKAINVNQANKDILKSIDPIITDDVVDEIMKRRNDPAKGGPFRDEADFTGFIGANTTTFNPSKIPLFFGSEYNFRIKSIGEYKGVTKEITAIVYDVEAVRDQLISQLDKDNPPPTPAGGTPPQPTPGTPAPGAPPATDQSKKKKVSTTPPRVIYYHEN